MAQVQGPTPAKRIHDKTNKILAVTEVKMVMIRHSGPDGAESLTLAYIIGEANYGAIGAPEERMLGIWTAANMKQLQENLRLVSKDQAKNIISALEEKGIVSEGRVVGSTTPQLPDLSNEFDDVGGTSKKEKDE